MLRLNMSLRENLRFPIKLQSLCFLAENMNYVRRAKALEEVKNTSTFADSAFQTGKYMLLLKSESVFTDENYQLLWKSAQDVQSITQNYLPYQKILLDLSSKCDGEHIYLFAIDLNVASDQDVKDLETKLGGKFINARESLLRLNYKECKYLVQAKGLSHFTKTFNFCPNCGSKLVPNLIGTQKQCKKCQQTHYPFVSPVGIVLLEDVKHEKVLLVHQKRHPAGMYSCVAGFIEPGETLYESIKREVAEEVGLDIINVEFCTSQPWAMPASQLMLACIATVDGANFDLDEREILSAKWVVADVLQGALSRINSWKNGLSVTEETKLWVPPAFTASHQIMVEWLKKYHSC